MDFKKRRKGKPHSENVRALTVAEEFCLMLFRRCWRLMALLGGQDIEKPQQQELPGCD